VKGIIRIGGALVIGIIIIFSAFSVNDREIAANGQVVVAPAPTRIYIETKDWQASLPGRGFATIDTPTSTILLPEEIEAYAPPTTFTEKFSEAFLEDYLKGKIREEDFGDPTALVGNAVTAIKQNTQSKRYTRAEIRTEPTTGSGMYIYGNQIASIVQKHSINNENELLILGRALNTNDPKILKDLIPIEQVYTRAIQDTLTTPVPLDLVQEHLTLLNAYEAIKTDLSAMQLTFTDPLYALARTKGYDANSKALLNAYIAIAQKLNRAGINYNNTEPGTFFYLFES